MMMIVVLVLVLVNDCADDDLTRRCYLGKSIPSPGTFPSRHTQMTAKS